MIFSEENICVNRQTDTDIVSCIVDVHCYGNLYKKNLLFNLYSSRKIYIFAYFIERTDSVFFLDYKEVSLLKSTNCKSVALPSFLLQSHIFTKFAKLLLKICSKFAVTFLNLLMFELFGYL